MEFWAGKIAWALFAPSHLLIILLFAFMIIRMPLWLRSFLCTGIAAFLLAALLLPIGDWALVPLEQCEGKTQIPLKVDGVIVLGGALNEAVTVAVGDAEFNSAVDRLLSMLKLMKTYPQAQLIYSGGSGDMTVPGFKEADYVKKMIGEIGLDDSRVIAEDASRNTKDNVINTMPYFAKTPGQNWLIVTSAYHMPRALSLFREVGAMSRTQFYPYPADFKTTGKIELKFNFDLTRNLKKLDTAMKEYSGLAVNKLLGRSKRFLPCGEVEKEKLQ